MPAGVTEVEYKRAFQRLEQGSARHGPGPRAESKSMIDAAALQLDMSRRLNLGGMSQSKSQNGNRNHHRGSKRRSIEASKKIGDGSDSAATRPAAPVGPWASSSRTHDAMAAPKTSTGSSHVFCMSCRVPNPSTETVCVDCGFFLEGPIRPAPPTLAQRRGLAEPPAQMDAPVARSEWEVIEAKLIGRHDATCPICMEGFNQGYEVLLSCSHIFHRSCLESFERFMGRDTRSCPICRKTNYQKKITKCGTAAWEVQCVVRVQATFRGFLQRQRFYDLYFRDAPSREVGGDTEGGQGSRSGLKLLRRRYLSHELTVLANARKKEMDRVVSGLDATLTENQELDLLFEQMLRTRQTYHEVAGVSDVDRERELEQEALETDQRELARELARLDDRGGAMAGGGGDDTGASAEGAPGVTLSPEQWQEVLTVARRRGLGQCSICLCDNKGLRGLSLLSCSHLFHSTCLLSFQRFSQDRKVGASSTHSCYLLYFLLLL